ncbi:hypothetical protein VUR80DRAFT_3052 [Thermomyces stellatus]
MGNDGGSIPTRRELVKSASRAPTVSELKATALESLAHAWSHCPLTTDKLDLDNTVSDWRGRLYNYESVLKNLMAEDSDGGEPAAAEVSFASTGIRSLKDIVKVRFKKDTASGKERWTCPVSMKEFGAGTRAVYLVPCGHAFAEVAIKEVGEERRCPECSEAFEEENVIPILPTTEADTKRLVERMERLQAEGMTHSLKKDKKGGKKKRKRGEEGKAENGNGNEQSDTDDKESKATRKDDRVSGINNPRTSSLTAKVLAEQAEVNKRRKMAAAMASKA